LAFALIACDLLKQKRIRDAVEMHFRRQGKHCERSQPIAEKIPGDLSRRRSGFAGCCQLEIVVHPSRKAAINRATVVSETAPQGGFAPCCRTLCARRLFDVGKTQFCHGKNLSFKRAPFLLAVDFNAGVVLSALTIAKQIRDVCSFPLLLTFDRFHD
jgi:hypothetical protein